MSCLNFIGVELENPFGQDDNDLPLDHFQDEMNNCPSLSRTELFWHRDPKEQDPETSWRNHPFRGFSIAMIPIRS